MLTIILLSITCFVYAQQSIPSKLTRSFTLKADRFIGIDELENLYYIKGNTLCKKEKGKILTYANNQLGYITSVDITNPLKVLVFHGNFNTVQLLDNQLNELTKPINFTSESVFKNITNVAISSNDNIWLYSTDDSVLSLFNYQTKKILFNSQPLEIFKKPFMVTSLNSNYKYAWLGDGNSLLKFNEYGTFLEDIPLIYDEIVIWQDQPVFLNGDRIFIHNTDGTTSTFKTDTTLKIKSFYLQENNLYIFDGQKIFVFQFLKI